MFPDVLTPVTLFFFILLTGFLVSKIKLRYLQFDISTNLIIALLLGFFLKTANPALLNEEFMDAMSFYSDFGGKIFISAIGILGGYTLKLRKESLSSLLCGAFTSLVAAGILFGILLLDSSVNPAILTGIFCGALTTTPGLSAAQNNSSMAKSALFIGYGISYFFGVLSVLWFVQALSSKREKAVAANKQSPCRENEHSLFVSLSLLAVPALIGACIEELLPPGFPIGTTGCTLFAAILTGNILAKTKLPLPSYGISNLKDLGLILFFIGNGIKAGYSFSETIEPKYFLYGILFSCAAIATAFFISKLLHAKEETALSLIAGSMTSSPAFGVLSKTGFPIDASAYSLSYLGALITTVALLSCL